MGLKSGLAAEEVNVSILCEKRLTHAISRIWLFKKTVTNRVTLFDLVSNDSTRRQRCYFEWLTFISASHDCGYQASPVTWLMGRHLHSKIHCGCASSQNEVRYKSHIPTASEVCTSLPVSHFQKTTEGSLHWLCISHVSFGADRTSSILPTREMRLRNNIT